jgi:Ion channel
MLRQFLMGGGVSACNIVIHALVMTAVVRASQVAAMKVAARPNLLLISVMVATVSILMAAHASEVVIWSLGYRLVNAAPASANLLYFAFVNYTTLGYGDVVPVERWQLIAPMTAMNGVLLFGWSTAVIFEVLRKAMSITASHGRLSGRGDILEK